MSDRDGWQSEMIETLNSWGFIKSGGFGPCLGVQYATPALDPLDSIHGYGIPIPPHKRRPPSEEDFRQPAKPKKRKPAKPDSSPDESPDNDGRVDDYA